MKHRRGTRASVERGTRKTNPVSSLTAKDLRALVTVAECGSLTGAARILRVSQSSLSRTISRLERILNVALFTRTTRRIDLTLLGSEFAATSERALSNLQRALTSIKKVTDDKNGRILVSTFPQFAQEVLPPFIANYRKNRVNTEIHVRSGSNSDVISDVKSGLVDFGITFGDAAPGILESIQLKLYTLCALIPTGHELAKSTAPLSFAELDKAPMVSLPREAYTRKVIDEAATAGHITLNHVVIVPGFLEQMTNTRAGVGISLVPSSTLLGSSTRYVTVRAVQDPQLSASVNMLSFPGRQMNPAAICFRSMLIDATRSHK